MSTAPLPHPLTRAQPTRPLTEVDEPAAIALLERAGLASGAQNIGRYLRWQPDGAWGTFEGDALIGMVTLLHQGDAGFVGCMAVEPALHGRGIGRHLLEHAHAEGRRAGLATFLLEATAAGEPLYRRLGYVTEHDTVMMHRPAASAGALAPIATVDRADVLALDRRATGTSRDVMLTGLLDDFPGVALRSSGELVGYGLVVGTRLGPVIARDAAAGRALIAGLAGACEHAAVPGPNDGALAAVKDQGFVEARRLRRMRLGPAIPLCVDQVWTLASAGAG